MWSALLLGVPLPARAEDPRIEHARALAHEGQLEAALDAYDVVLAGGSASREARLGRARVLGWLGRHAESQAALDALLAESPDDAEALVLRARVLGWSRRYAEAEADARRALALTPGSSEAQLVLGDVLAWSGRADEAAAAHQEALRLSPDSLEARQRLEDAPRERRGRLDYGLRFDSLDGGRSDWWQQDLLLAFRARPDTTLYGGLAHSRRYDEGDVQGSLGFSQRVGRAWWLGAAVTLGPEAEVAARYAVDLDVARRLDEGVTLQLHYRRSGFADDVETDALTPGLELTPFASLVLSARYHLTRVTGNGLGHAGSLRAELFPERALGAYAWGSYGTEAFAPSTVQSTRSRARAVSGGVGFRWRHPSGLVLRLGYAFEDLESTLRRHGLESGIGVEF